MFVIYSGLSGIKLLPILKKELYFGPGILD